MEVQDETPTMGSETQQNQITTTTGEGNHLPTCTTTTTTTKRSKPSKKRKTENTGGNDSKQKSWVWDHFVRDETTPKDNPKAICGHCGALIGCHAINHGTGAMNNHLGRCKEYGLNKDMKQKVLSFDKRGEGANSNKLVSWSFNKEVSRDMLARMIVIDELPFSHVEGEGFRYFCYSLCPMFEHVSRRTICRDVIRLHECQKAIIKDVFANSTYSVCLTTDTWTSIQNVNYMVLTAHFIDDNWILHKRILSFCVITDHKGESIGKLIGKCIREWGIKRVLTISVDNESANEVAINYVKKQLKVSNKCVLNGEFLHVRCCAHILNLIVNDGLKVIQNSVASIRTAVRYVRSSPTRLNKFKEFVKGLNIVDKTALVLDIPTRWNSTYLMLEGAIKYQKAFEQMEEEDGHYISYFNGETPCATDWDNAKVFVHFLKTFYEVTLKFSCTLSVTSSTCLPEVMYIEDEINGLIKSEDVLLSNMALSMKRKYDKYWGSLSKMNNILLIACVLDPRFKLQYVRLCFEDVYYGEGSNGLEIAMKEVKDTLMRLYDWYNERRVQTNLNESLPIPNSQQQEINTSKSTIGGSKMEKHLKNVHAQDVCSNEVDKYLNEVVESCHDGSFDVQAWWKINCVRYKVLSEVARDVFAIPVSTVASESAFSTGGRIIDPYRSCLTPKMVEVLVTTQNWIKSRALKGDECIETLVEDIEFYDEVLDDIVGLNLRSEV